MAAHSGDLKKKSVHANHLPRDGMTGMGLKTQQHFVEVQKKLIDYVGEQEAGFEDQMPLQDHHYRHRHGHHHNHHFSEDFLLLDGKRNSPKHNSAPSSPALGHRKLTPGGLASPKVNHRHQQPSPRPHAPK